MLIKLMKVQNALKSPKNQENKFGGYKYRSCEDILESLKPLLFEHGLLLTLSDEIVVIGDRYYVQATATVMDADGNYFSTKALAREAEDRPKMDSSQVTGSASSYARKYALNGLFCIDDTKDADYYDNSDCGLRLKKRQIDEILEGCKNHSIDINIILDTFKVQSINDLTLKNYASIMNNFRKKESKANE